MEHIYFDGYCLEEAVNWHLSYNFYPGSMGMFINQALEAIANCTNGDCNKLVTMPNGQQETSYHIIEVLRLEDMIEPEL